MACGGREPELLRDGDEAGALAEEELQHVPPRLFLQGSRGRGREHREQKLARLDI